VETQLRGKYSIASAAYWWGRVAAGVVRAAHKLSDVNLGVLRLLFADDGWVVATGKYFWRKLLYWLFILELLEIPISWKKVKAGTTVQWIGYTLYVCRPFERASQRRRFAGWKTGCEGICRLAEQLAERLRRHWVV